MIDQQYPATISQRELFRFRFRFNAKSGKKAKIAKREKGVRTTTKGERKKRMKCRVNPTAVKQQCDRCRAPQLIITFCRNANIVIVVCDHRPHHRVSKGVKANFHFLRRYQNDKQCVDGKTNTMQLNRRAKNNILFVVFVRDFSSGLFFLLERLMC